MPELTHTVRNIVILTGAGLSAESGLATFRGPGGLWEGHRVEDVCTPEALAHDPSLVHRFYDERRAGLHAVKPNAAHRALARLDAEWPGELLIVTQNVDDLHERAGAARLIHLHGELNSAFCAACDHRQPWQGDLPPGTPCPACAALAMRPDIVFFGEMPYDMDRVQAALAACDLFVSIGTSGAVYPAAGFVQLAANAGARTLELNLERSAGSDWFDDSRLGPATALVPAWVDEVLAAPSTVRYGPRRRTLMAETIPVELADHWLVYLKGLIQTRRFGSLDEAIESGIRLLEADQNSEDRLAQLLEEGEREGGFEEWDYDKFRAEMRQRTDARKAA